ncbi:hypothetical protein OHA72_12075 [Dactylosporangium sp. NBC_01737]|uniref:hypothetical protein n=1 Tax=Dactylosporangium sp. NBC_01737 TaxID=2975959 RepID=UPI002E13219A|nr:hypothetical protein OHA72_12075 [Dactylosporangium sp. NBC_01737]
MRSPKLGGSPHRQYYKYYAGYTQGFVEDMLRSLQVPADGIVLDPWNGVGTTTVAATATGLNAFGYDINPAAVIIGRARLIGSDVADSLLPIAVEICDRACSHQFRLRNDDLLSTWFGPSTATEIRALERAVFRILVDPDCDGSQPVFQLGMPHTSLASVYYVALFRAVRELVRAYVPSNQSWIKNPAGRRLGVRRSELHRAFLDAVKVSNPYLGQLEIPLLTKEGVATIGVASSTGIPMDDKSVDAIVSSPPYCTRLDYVKATLPELAVVGLTSSDIRRLRDQMIGTPTISGSAEDATPSVWGQETATLIDLITSHSSKASSTYYKKYYLQYFSGMWSSLNELHRVVKPGGLMALVVQDSFYKDVHVDLPALILDMGTQAGWTTRRRVNFTVPRTMASIHPGSRQYRQDFRAVESAIVLERV